VDLVDGGLPFLLPQLPLIVVLNRAGYELSLNIIVPPSFIGSERIAEEFRLNGSTHARLATYTETSNKIIKDYTYLSAITGSPNVVRLPFEVEQSVHQEIIWNAGDNWLRDKVWGQNLPANMIPVLRVTFRSTAKALTGTTKEPARAV
jgi:hypothetical protein